MATSSVAVGPTNLESKLSLESARNPVEEAHAGNAGNEQPYEFSPIAIRGEPLSATIMRDRGRD